jgi:hypothetical protein
VTTAEDVSKRTDAEVVRAEAADEAYRVLRAGV